MIHTWIVTKHHGFTVILLMFFCNWMAVFSQQSNITFSHLTILDGLSNNTVLSIYQDSYGYMWFGTRDGLNKYDGYEFEIFRYDPNSQNTLSGNHIEIIYEDKHRNLWISSESNSLDLYDRKDRAFVTIQEFLNDSTIEINGIVRAMLHDSRDNFWIGTSEGLLRYSFNSGKIKVFEADEQNILPTKLVNAGIYDLIEDASHSVWIGTYQGLSKFNYESGEFIHFKTQTHLEKGMVDDYILDIHSLNDSILLIGTNNAGLLKYNANKETFTTFPGIDDRYQLTSVQKIIRDSSYLWVSSDNGLYTYHFESGNFTYHFHDDRNLSTISSNNVLDLFQDNAGTVWISHWHDGISYYNVCANKFEHFKKEPCLNSINNNTVRAIALDQDKDLWLATDQGGLNIRDHKTGLFHPFTTDDLIGLPSNVCKDILVDGMYYLIATSKGLVVYKKSKIQKSIGLINITNDYLSTYKDQELIDQVTNANVESLYSGYTGDIWIGTSRGLFHLNGDKITYGSASNSMYNPIYQVMEDFEGIIWVGCLNGLYKYNKRTNQFTSQNNRLNPGNLRIRINSITEDHKKNLWIGTNGQGIYVLNNQRKRMEMTELNEQLPSMVINAFIETSGYMWVTTNKGMVKINKSNFSPESTYSSMDGLQSNQFYRNSAYKDQDDYIYIGGVNGFNRFHQDDIVLNKYLPPIYITDIWINNERISPGHSLFGKVIDNPIETEDQVFLNHKHALISFEFKSLNYLTPEKNQYAYKLLGFDDSETWNLLGNQRKISYTNLEPGKYTLIVKGSNNDGLWNKDYRFVEISMLPPWWKTIFFKILVVVFVLSLIYLLKKWITYNLNLRNTVKVERLEKEKIREVEQMKLRFFTNISHEFRTPLTLILSPIEKVIQNNKLNSKDKLQLSLMKNNAKRLLRLVNQIMDMRKMEAGKLKLEAKYGDIVPFVKSIVSSFEPIAREKSINLVFTALSGQVYTLFDEDKIDKIIYNLLSNAFKYSPNGGKILVSVMIISKTEWNEKQQERFIEITVEDSGPGIPQAIQKKIFDRFYQYEESTMKVQGTGIGLSLTKDLIELHNGSISLVSPVNKGSDQNMGTRFTIHLPFIENAESQNLSLEQEEPERKQINEGPKLVPGKNTIILVVEDNSDMRTFIKANLHDEFIIMEAVDGMDGFKTAITHIPDLILCDVMMPGLDGIEFTKKVKMDERTSHIPIILLTAKTSEESKIGGLEKGAEDYITKPFNIDILRQKILNILHTRRLLQEKLSNQIMLEPTNVKIESHDQKFLARAVKVVEKNIDNSDLNVDHFSREIGISKMQLYRKMNALTNQTVREFIKTIRLKRAAQLLEQNVINISEVAYAVGFTDISYFRKCFKKQFGVTPSEYKHKKSG